MNNPQNEDSALFPVCEYRARFGEYHNMADAKHWNSYMRSVDKRHPNDVTQYQFTFLSNRKQTTQLAKTGAFFSPFHYDEYKDAVQPIRGPAHPILPNIYDMNIIYQRMMAQYIVTKIREDKSDGHKALKVNCDNGYTCILLDFGMRESIDKKRGWVNFLSIFFVAIMNELSCETGINIEMVRRSSFGSLRPAVSDCEPSMRINPGLIPKAYADLIVRGILILNKIVNTGHYLDHFDEEIDLLSFKEDIESYFDKKNKAKKRGNAKKTLEVADTVWEALWNGCDFQNKSGMTQLSRNEKTLESIIDQMLSALFSTPEPLSNILENKKLFVKCFVKPFSDALETLTIQNSTVKITYAEEPETFEWSHTGSHLPMDDEFRNFLSQYLRFFNQTEAQITRFIAETPREDFYYQLEKISTAHVFHPRKNIEATDGYGSDSDVEADLDVGKNKTVSVKSKKLICATGMRAIQLAFYAIKFVKSEETGRSYFASRASTEYMYYETEEALEGKHNLQPSFNVRDKYQNKFGKINIPFFDLNYANVAQTHKTLSLPSNNEFVVLDVTSSTVAEMRQALKDLFKDPETRAVIFVSSGLKHEQMMTDRNPYGTVRIFAKTRALREALYNAVLSKEDDCYLKTHGQNKTKPVLFAYQHPKPSHLLRKSMKEQGATPTNRNILTEDNNSGYQADNESPAKPKNKSKQRTTGTE